MATGFRCEMEFLNAGRHPWRRRHRVRRGRVSSPQRARPDPLVSLRGKYKGARGRHATQGLGGHRSELSGSHRLVGRRSRGDIRRDLGGDAGKRSPNGLRGHCTHCAERAANDHQLSPVVWSALSVAIDRRPRNCRADHRLGDYADHRAQASSNRSWRQLGSLEDRRSDRSGE